MRFRISASYNKGQMKVYLKVLFLRFELYGDKKSKIKKSDFKIRKFRRRRDKVLKKYKVSKTPLGQLKENIVKRIKKMRQGTSDGQGNGKKQSPLLLIKNVKNMLWDTVLLFGRRHRIERFEFEVSVGGKDAHSVALNYGYVISALQYLVTLLEMKTNLDKTRRKKAEVRADFATEKWDASINFEMSLRTFDIIWLGISALKGYLKHKTKSTPQKAGKNKKDGK